LDKVDFSTTFSVKHLRLTNIQLCVKHPRFTRILFFQLCLGNLIKHFLLIKKLAWCMTIY